MLWVSYCGFVLCLFLMLVVGFRLISVVDWFCGLFACLV